MQRLFFLNIVSFEKFSTNPFEVLNDPNLVIRIDNDYYDWISAAPLIISMLCFKQPLPINNLGLQFQGGKPQQNFDSDLQINDEGMTSGLEVRSLENIHSVS